MPKIRLTKEFRFEMAHALWNYDGLCKNIHGHSYILFVTIIGEPIADESNPKYGMVMDFGELKQIVKEEVVDQLDHTVMISDKAPVDKLRDIPQMTDRYQIVSFQPTCENLLSDFVNRIVPRLPQGVELFSLKLHETGNSYAEWFASDN